MVMAPGTPGMNEVREFPVATFRLLGSAGSGTPIGQLDNSHRLVTVLSSAIRFLLEHDSSVADQGMVQNTHLFFT